MVEKKFQVLLLDPPWNERGGGRIKRGADRHYDLMKYSEIEHLVVNEWRLPERVLDTSVCYMWVTNNFLEKGLKLLKAIGFRYVTNLVWTKPSFGIGFYTRGQHELCLYGVSKEVEGPVAIPMPEDQHQLCLFGVKGSPGRQRVTCPTWLGQKALPKGRHSEKPSELHEKIEELFDGPYLECFAREAREGWEVLGNEVETGLIL